MYQASCIHVNFTKIRNLLSNAMNARIVLKKKEKKEKHRIANIKYKIRKLQSI